MSVATIKETARQTILPGHQHVINQIIKLKSNNKLPHAILIELKTQVDCSEFGFYLVQSLLCQSENNVACGICSNCTLMQSNNYPDFTYTTLLEDEKTHKMSKFIKVEQIRRLIHQISLTDNQGYGKYALINPAEKMNLSSANSLLKTLEEPPKDSTLILLSHNPGKLPVTIRSRCQQWVLNNPENSVAKKWLSNKGLSDNQIEDLLTITRNDAEFSLTLHQAGYEGQHSNFQNLLEQFLNDQIDVSSLVKSIDLKNLDILRLIFKSEINQLITKETLDATDNMKSNLAQLLDILKSVDKTLNIEENNLNLQLQLEDVLISLKRNISRG